MQPIVSSAIWTPLGSTSSRILRVFRALLGESLQVVSVARQLVVRSFWAMHFHEREAIVKCIGSTPILGFNTVGTSAGTDSLVPGKYLSTRWREIELRILLFAFPSSADVRRQPSFDGGMT